MATKRLCTSLHESTKSSKVSTLFAETSVRCDKGLLVDGSCPATCEGYVDKLDLMPKKD